MQYKDKETTIANKMRSLENEIRGLERELASETDPDKQRDLQRRLDQAKRDLTEAESELTRIVMDANNYI